MGIYSKSKSWNAIKKITIEDSVGKLIAVSSKSDFKLANYEVYIPFGYFKKYNRERKENLFIVGNISLITDEKTFPYIDLNLVKLYYKNSLVKIEYGLTADIRLPKEKITLIKDVGFKYEFKSSNVLTLSRTLSNLELKTIKDNLTDFLLEIQNIVLKF